MIFSSELFPSLNCMDDLVSYSCFLEAQLLSIQCSTNGVMCVFVPRMENIWRMLPPKYVKRDLKMSHNFC